jgi:hypothetical protein
MSKKKQSESLLISTQLPKSGMQMGNGGGAIDPSTLPKPTLPKWNGWKSVEGK